MRYNPRPVRRLARILLNATTALSLVLFTATVVLWVRSYFAADSYRFPAERVKADVPGGDLGFVTQLVVRSSRGKVQFLRHETVPHRAEPTGLGSTRTAPPPMSLQRTLPTDRSWQFGGIERFHRLPNRQQVANGSYLFLGFDYLALPWWMLTAVAAIMPAVWLLRLPERLRHLRRLRNRLCTKCGYDLRATPARCPECGAEPAKP
jgi:hypothetical protein